MSRSRRDMGLTALVEGFFAAAWFGWGHGGAPAGLAVWLTIGSVVALLVAVAGAVVAVRGPGGPRHPDTDRRYGIVVGIEFGLAGLGALILGLAGQPRFVPVWVCAVVGVHFFPLAPILGDRSLVPLGVLVSAVAVAALVVGLTTGVTAGTVTGTGTGIALLAFAIAALAGVWISSRQRKEHT